MYKGNGNDSTLDRNYWSPLV
jgi:hypothetical protein